ncbi:hypothetical protein K490DRAFT_70158 [Saccharata proteae CBS 121410]|uniref:Uncharacterized protein n=1 Tax=Saccharata proteae CBS 121410 TaxID=1314787 RepID=A0A9P4LR28_9PEZI|nr:hypothetical protein K490DRAFT_70158 [Saccharata proteae CBS 121410]
MKDHDMVDAPPAPPEDKPGKPPQFSEHSTILTAEEIDGYWQIYGTTNPAVGKTLTGPEDFEPWHKALRVHASAAGLSRFFEAPVSPPEGCSPLALARFKAMETKAYIFLTSSLSSQLAITVSNMDSPFFILKRLEQSNQLKQSRRPWTEAYMALQPMLPPGKTVKEHLI